MQYQENAFPCMWSYLNISPLQIIIKKEVNNGPYSPRSVTWVRILDLYLNLDSATHQLRLITCPPKLSLGALLKIELIALAGVAECIERPPANQKVAGWIPTQGTCLGCEPGPQLGACERQLISASLTR